MNLILSIEQCRTNLEAIANCIDSKLPQEPQRLMAILSDLASLLGNSAQVVASYQYHVDTARLMAVQEAKKAGYGGNMAKEYCEGRCAEIRAEMKLADRQNAALVHIIDAARSILSYCKQENFASQFQKG